ncbi:MULTISPECIES: sugar ABC transporter substrate-binding protein [unclassified Bacillus (in: firmicutes)]|uniref:sugar ABC transporter substrate-binding protein n=1 Tax=unclassified Bacillus (in: firmicutes) TaxID=185979 RepID=UPI0006603647|nr:MULTISPECIES: sugar ABC transporter substrate-binding protein [unclassified Bacillus (in: firmicutes)]CAI9389155.1 Ribose import binding protein RbsB [Bacillus sp. T2.9-1]
MKKFLIGLLTLVLTFGLAACNTSEESSSEKDQYVFGYTSMTQNNPYFQVVEKAIRDKVEANGDKLITTNPAMDVELQINQIEDMIAQGIDAIFLNPVDWEGIRPALAMLKEANIPIINYDAEVKDMEYITSYVGSDNKNAGKVAGEDLVKNFPDGGNIVILDSPTMNSVNDRIEGFMEAIEGKNFEIVAQQDAKGDLETALTVTEDILQAHSDIIAIMGGNDPTALGALAAVKAANIEGIAIYGVDGSPDAKTAIANGEALIGTGAQSPISIGEKSVEVAYKILKGEDYEKRIPVETFIINKDNVEEYGTDGWQ